MFTPRMRTSWPLTTPTARGKSGVYTDFCEELARHSSNPVSSHFGLVCGVMRLSASETQAFAITVPRFGGWRRHCCSLPDVRKNPAIAQAAAPHRTPSPASSSQCVTRSRNFTHVQCACFLSQRPTNLTGHKPNQRWLYLHLTGLAMASSYVGWVHGAGCSKKRGRMECLWWCAACARATHGTRTRWPAPPPGRGATSSRYDPPFTDPCVRKQILGPSSGSEDNPVLKPSPLCCRLRCMAELAATVSSLHIVMCF